MMRLNSPRTAGGAAPLAVAAAKALATLALAATALGCATTGSIPVELEQPETVYISPANEDGVQDSVSFPLSVELLERTEIERYTVTVTDSDGNPVRTDEVDYSADGLLERVAGPDGTVPEVVVWDGRDDAGDFVPDGEYRLVVEVRDNRGNTGSAGEQTVVVDNTPPEVDLSAPSLLFTPNGDGFLEELAVRQRDSSEEDRWVGVFAAADGPVVRRFEWDGRAADFSWDGTEGDGTPAPEATYTYTVTATDRAGNSAAYQLEGIELERDLRTVSLFISRTAFSPNGDGRADTLPLYASIPVLGNLERWTVDVMTADDEVVRTYSGSGEPPALEFDGRGDDDSPLPDGRYRAVLEAAYLGGQNPVTTSPFFTIDTVIPRATVDASEPVISPNGDGRLDTVEIVQASSDEESWTGTFRNASGTVVRSESWTGQVASFTWDGSDSSGATVADGRYTYRLSTVDAAGNPSEPAEVTIRVDTRPVSVRILPTETRFSPNGDGVRDTMSFSLLSDSPETIERWTVRLNDAGGEALGEIASGTESLPVRFSWDGRLNGSLLPDDPYYPELVAVLESGGTVNSLSPSVRVDTTGPEISVGFGTTLADPEDGSDDTLAINIWAADPSSIDGWSATMFGRAGGIFAEWSGEGRPPALIRWDGLSSSGNEFQMDTDYRLLVNATDTVGNAGSGETVASIDLLVTREGRRFRVSSIYFGPYETNFRTLEDPDLAVSNVEALDRLAELLERYPDYNVRIEGHAAHLLSFNPLRAQAEHVQVLVPLSFDRAEAVRDALAQRGIDRSRMSIWGHGGIHPVVPHTDAENRWMNRRVEFILERRR